MNDQHPLVLIISLGETWQVMEKLEIKVRILSTDELLPGFDPIKRPFIFQSKNKYLYLLNLRTGEEKKMIDDFCKDGKSQYTWPELGKEAI